MMCVLCMLCVLCGLGRSLQGCVVGRTGWLLTAAACLPARPAPSRPTLRRATLLLQVGRRLLFAGEHTAREHPDTVGGAMLSGLR